MSRSKRIRFSQLLTILTAWLLIGVVISIYDHLVLLTHSSQGLSADYTFFASLKQNLISALIGGVLGGSFLVFYINVRFQNRPYAHTILAVILSFGLIILIIILVKGVMFSHHNPTQSLVYFLRDTTRVKNILVWFIVVSLTQFLLQVSSKVGQKGLGHILRGKYHTPQEENRIFMFLDLNASTTLAEKLGDELYHQLLRDFFADITDPILNAKGEIYQYVGDEVVVAWDHVAGVVNNRCVRCYFDILQNIQSNKAKYIRRYGVVPEFRAGMHSGKVVAGEVGILKREITYSGDVLNTASRILSKAKEIGAGIVSSSALLGELNFDKHYTVRSIGPMKLKGKEQEVCLTEILLS
ncbi:adenylate cyclase [Chryseolinea serpens]|uniref:Adenylate cyclase n=1 Tax=Chryseolinea serpens TaxID=947013 RepID=A0A1M5RIS1_9BACT|nr:adenylate/guanylate cyclase domain-containing protein [Chryseolinea serpens]SHH26056.1 adenylate cyclase [Chryseolinea serpens]